MALLEVKELVSGYRDLDVLHGLNFQLEAGQFVSIVGSNGAGKTTLLRTISGLLKPRSGEIWLAGERVDGLEPHAIVERGITQVPEGRQLFPYMTVLENLEVGSYNRAARAQRQETLAMMFELFPILAERQQQQARTFSGGEQQMLATARALMSRPRLLMLDEPSWGLAPILVSRLFETLKQINQRGTTILLVEQNVGAALRLADHAYVLERGQIVLDGPGQELLARDELRAAYLGV